MEPPRSAPEERDPLDLGTDLDYLATAPDVIRWDLGERSIIERPKDRLCIFRIDRWVLAFSGALSRGIETLTTATPIPLAPSHILGLVHVRGQIVPLVDLNRCLQPRPTRRKALDPNPTLLALVLRVDNFDLCWVIDEVLGFEPFDLSRLQGDDGQDAETTGLAEEPPPLPTPWILGTTELPHHGRVTALDMSKVIEDLRVHPAPAPGSES